MARTSIRIAAASRPYAGETTNGDGWQVDWHGDTCRIAIIDGLGHGPEAATAASLAQEMLASHPDLAPEPALRACHAGLVGTRGAAISIASIDSAISQLIYVAVGNTEAHLWQHRRQQRLIAYRGIVGSVLPTVHPFSFTLEPDWLLLMHTDGIRARFHMDSMPVGLRQDPHELAEGILLRWGRLNDDATVVVARSAPPLQ